MEISDQVKRYLKVYSMVLIACVGIYSSSVYTFSCDKWARYFKDDVKFHLVLKSKHNQGRDAYLSGWDLETKRDTEYNETSGAIEEIIDSIKIGDTLLKDIGKYPITIKSKNKKIVIPCECNGTVYK